MVRTMQCLYLVFGLAWTGIWCVATANAQTSPPAIVVEVGFDNDNQESSLTWYPASTDTTGWRSVALRLSGITSGATTTAERTWAIVLGRAYLEITDPNKQARPDYQSAAAQLMTTYPWLTKRNCSLPANQFQAAYTNGGPMESIANRFESAHLSAMNSLPLAIDPVSMAGVLGACVTARPNDNGVREWAQPFLLQSASGPIQNSMTWHVWCSHWADPVISPGGVSNWIWSSTYSRSKSPADFATGTHMFSVNRLAEMIITYQTSNPNDGRTFLQSSAYHTALDCGLHVALQVITVRAPTGPMTNSPFTTAGLGSGLYGISISSPLVINPVVSGPDIGPHTVGDVGYAIEPATPYALTPGQYAIVALGQSPDVDHAVFQKLGGSFVSAPLSFPFATAGVASFVVPSAAIAGSVTFEKFASPPNAWATIVQRSTWAGAGAVLVPDADVDAE